MTIYNKKHIPYTYLIGWSKLDTWYYGVVWKNFGTCIANPVNLWTCYFTSSKHVKQFRKDHGEPDVIQIRKIFATAKEATSWEAKVLKRMNVVPSPRWLNKTINKSKSSRKGIPHTAETKAKISSTLKGGSNGPHSEETKRKIGEALRGIPKNLTEEQRQNLSNHFRNANKGKPKSAAHRDKMLKANLGRKHSEETKAKMSEA